MAESVKKGVPVEKTGPENWMEEKLRLNKKQFMVLLKKVKPHFARHIPENLDPFPNLMDALKFLVTGEGCLCCNMGEVLNCIHLAVAEYNPFPDRPETWLEIAKEFETTWNVKNTVGAIISDRVYSDLPKLYHSSFADPQTRELGQFMVCVVDAKYRFLFSSKGAFGTMKSPDGLIQFLEPLLEKSPLPKDSSKKDSYAFAADEGFSFRPWMRVCNDRMPKEYNEEIKRALKPGQIAYEIIFSRFGILSSTLNVHQTAFSPHIFRTIQALHNYFLAHNPAYAPEYKDTKKWVDAKIEKIPRSGPVMKDDDDWMKKICLTEEVLKKLVQEMKINRFPWLRDVSKESQLKMYLRFLVTGELAPELMPSMDMLLMDFLEFLVKVTKADGNKDLADVIALEDKFKLDRCTGILVTKRCSLGMKISDPALIVLWIVGGTGRAIYHSSAESKDDTAEVVESLVNRAGYGQMKPNSIQNSTFFVASEKKIPNEIIITPKCPRGQCPGKIQAAVEYGQRVLKKICATYSAMNFNAETMEFPIFKIGTEATPLVHNWFLENNPDYAMNFKDL